MELFNLPFLSRSRPQSLSFCATACLPPLILSFASGTGSQQTRASGQRERMGETEQNGAEQSTIRGYYSRIRKVRCCDNNEANASELCDPSFYRDDPKDFSMEIVCLSAHHIY